MKDVWVRGGQTTVRQLLDQRLEANPDGEYLDVLGTKITAADVAAAADALAGAFAELGLLPGDRIATLMDNSVEAVLVWFGTLRAGCISVPVNTAYKGDYLTHQLRDSATRVLVVDEFFLDRVEAVLDSLPDVAHVVVVGAERPLPGVVVHQWNDLVASGAKAPDVDVRPSDLAMFIYTGGTTGPSKGCMLSHNYTEVISSQIKTCLRRTSEDVAWAPLPLFHFNAYANIVVGTLVSGGRGALYGRFSVSNFWPEVNRVGVTIACTLGSMAYLLAHAPDVPEMPGSGRPEANTTLRMLAGAPMPAEIDRRLGERFGIETFSGGFGLTEASLISWLPEGVPNKPDAAGIINDEYFDVRIFDDDDNELPVDGAGEIVIRPKRPHVMFEGYWGRPEATVDLSRNWWFHTGDIGKVDTDDYLFFLDRKKDYLRRRGENISSNEVEGIILKHQDISDVAVHAVPSDVLEDDLKVTAVLRAGATVTEEELLRWCVDHLPFFAMPRYVEFRDDLPKTPVGRVMKRELRDEGVTAATWDSVAAGVTFDRR